jgi:hypothetical protein
MVKKFRTAIFIASKNIIRCILCITAQHYLSRKSTFEVLTAVIIKRTVFWDKVISRSVKLNRGFGGTYCLQVQGRRVFLSVCLNLFSCLAYSSALKM